MAHCQLVLNFFLPFQSALQELEELKQIVPKESLVYFLIGKVGEISLCFVSTLFSFIAEMSA